jgi:hypothetical protein
VGALYGGNGLITIISSDTTWTESRSPYSLDAVVHVNKGASLTIEAGTTVKMNGFYILVNGALVARGNSTNQIQFKEGLISFTDLSERWNEQTDSGSIIENAVLDKASVVAKQSIKLANSYISGHVFAFGNSPIITGNKITGNLVAYESTIVSHNIIETPMVCSDTAIITYNNILDGMVVSGGTPTISNNHILCTNIDTAYMIGRDPVYPAVFVASGTPTIAKNNITKQNDKSTGGGIALGTKISVYIYDNIISGFTWGITGDNVGTVVIERNLVTGNSRGIQLGGPYGEEIGEVIINNNTITGNHVGVEGCNTHSTGMYNNIYDNGAYNLKSSINATHNWWGTTDPTAIKERFIVAIKYLPFLTEPNPEATPRIDSSSLPTPVTDITYSSSDTTSTQIEVYSTTAVLDLGACTFFLIALCVKKKSRLQRTITVNRLEGKAVD